MSNSKKNISPTERQYQYIKSRMYIYVTKPLRAKLIAYADSDPRFTSWSKCAVYLIKLGLKHDVKDRTKALESVEK